MIMAKSRTLLIVLFFLSGTGLADDQEQKLGVTLDLTYVSRYIWRGMDIYPQHHSATQPSIDIDLYGTGFGLNVWSSMANRSGFEEDKEMDYTVYYNNTIFEDEVYATNYNVGWTCYTYPNLPRKAADMQELIATLCWPKFLPAGLVPHYTIVCTWPSASHSDVSDDGGWLHMFGLCWELPITPWLPGTKEQTVELSAEATYNDDAYGPQVNHDWSHVVFGVSTGFDLGGNLAFKPGFYYQSSLDNSNKIKDQYWVSLGFDYKF